MIILYLTYRHIQQLFFFFLSPLFIPMGLIRRYNLCVYPDLLDTITAILCGLKIFFD